MSSDGETGDLIAERLGVRITPDGQVSPLPPRGAGAHAGLYALPLEPSAPMRQMNLGYPDGYQDPPWDGTMEQFRDVVIPARVAALQRSFSDVLAAAGLPDLRFEFEPVAPVAPGTPSAAEEQVREWIAGELDRMLGVRTLRGRPSGNLCYPLPSGNMVHVKPSCRCRWRL